MLLLAVDTATTSCSVAVSQSDRVLVEITKNIRQTHARQVMNLIDLALQSSHKQLEELDGFVVTRGPGSFTGLRIGISTVKGLALATGKPLVGVSCLTALASQMPVGPYMICPMIDARRNEVYSALYRGKGDRWVRCRKEAVTVPEQALAGIKEACLFVGSGALLYQQLIMDSLGARARLAPSWQHILRGAAISQLGFIKMQQQQFEELGCFGPLYLRKSDAEINFQRRELKKHSPAGSL